jgi:hypothetical protein
MSNITVLESLGDNKFVVQLKRVDTKHVRTNRIFMAHDYASFESSIYGANANGSTNFDFKAYSEIHIPVKPFVEVALPFFNTHAYCQPVHLADRTHTETSAYMKEGTNEPKYKKGDTYPAYSYQDNAIYYPENGVWMVAFCMNGEKKFSTVTAKVYEEYILPKIQ